MVKLNLRLLRNRLFSVIDDQYMGGIPQETLKEVIQSGAFSQIVMPIFSAYLILRFMYLLLGNAGVIKINSIIELIGGFFLAYIMIKFQPNVTPDLMIIFLCCFLMIKLVLLTITKILKIPTRHFGSFETKMIYPKYGIAVAVDKKERREES
ncbi:hypothetical protein [Clostridium sp. E02]|uniref:hypothetical protein n=1 Tax=Clostridium sp. E02 TaxID=2487134 RepID=UPI000F526B04|nr:hypothetical protein [Clostridium sp. E02]